MKALSDAFYGLFADRRTGGDVEIIGYACSGVQALR